MNEIDKLFCDIKKNETISSALFGRYSGEVANNFSDDEINAFEQSWWEADWSYEIVNSGCLDWEVDRIYNFTYRFNGSKDTDDFGFFTDNFLRLSKQKEFVNLVKRVLEKRFEKGLTHEIYIGFAFYSILKKYNLYVYSSGRVDFLRLWKIIKNNPNLLVEFESILSNFVHSETHDLRYDNIYKFINQLGNCNGMLFLDVGNSNSRALSQLLDIDGLNFIGLDLIIHENESDVIDESRLKFIRGDARFMPFSEKTFDFINFSYVLFHHDEMLCKKMLLEAYRSLKEGGYIFIQPTRRSYHYGNPKNETMVLRKIDGKLVRQKLFID